MSDQYQPIYTWRQTWPGEGYQDFTGFDGEESFGRVQLDQMSHGRTGMWKWDVTHPPWIRQYIVPHTGWEETAREACRRVEELYHKLLELHDRPKNSP
ncbi:hypothetical protein EHI48_30090 [Rhizobium sp. WSM1325]|nr:hypothetical protein EHI48_30090 [Rhizobium leguminosarum]